GGEVFGIRCRVRPRHGEVPLEDGVLAVLGDGRDVVGRDLVEYERAGAQFERLHCACLPGQARGRKPTLSYTRARVASAISAARSAFAVSTRSSSAGSASSSSARARTGSNAATTASAVSDLRSPYPRPANSASRASIDEPPMTE